MLAPDLPELEPVALAQLADPARIAGVRVQGGDAARLSVARARVRESELHGVTFDGEAVRGLELLDVSLRDCGLSNLVTREARLRRVEVRSCQLVGLGLEQADLGDVRFVDCSMALASLAAAQLHSVVFESVTLTEAVFMEARLRGVQFIDCRLAGADFRGATLTGCEMRGCSLDGVVGVDSLRGLRMSWPDVLDSAGALAAALGIVVDTD